MELCSCSDDDNDDDGAAQAYLRPSDYETNRLITCNEKVSVLVW